MLKDYTLAKTLYLNSDILIFNELTNSFDSYNKIKF